MQGKAKDAGGLSPVKDDNAALRFPVRRSFLIIFGCCFSKGTAIAAIDQREAVVSDLKGRPESTKDYLLGWAEGAAFVVCGPQMSEKTAAERDHA